MPVRVGKGAKATEVLVETLPEKDDALVPNGRIKVSFPDQPANAIFELEATITIAGPFGLRGTAQQHVWSHILTAEQEGKLVEAMMSTAAKAASVSEKIITASDLDVPPSNKKIVSDVSSRHARMFRLATMRAIQDKRITLGEFKKLIRTAIIFNSK